MHLWFGLPEYSLSSKVPLCSDNSCKPVSKKKNVMTGDVVHGVRQVPLVVMAARPQDEHRAGHVSALISRVFCGMSGSSSAAVSGQADCLHQGRCWRSVGVGVVVCVVSSSTAVSGQADCLSQGCC